MKNPRDLPDLNLLKGFEASARLLSFTRAATELHLTQSAISRQMRMLENQLNVALFSRRARTLQLTDAGKCYQALVTDTLDRLRDATTQIQRSIATAQDTLSITTSVTIASLWLVPRLADFQRQHPEISTRVIADNAFRDIGRDGIDIAIRYCTRQFAGKGAIRLFGERVVPVCSPSLLSRSTLTCPNDLKKFALLHFEYPENRVAWISWNTWFDALKLKPITGAGRQCFSLYDQMIAAAVGGQGVALGRLPLIESLIQSGKLTIPFKARRFAASTQGRAYWLIASPGAAARAGAGHFIRWLTAAPNVAQKKRPLVSSHPPTPPDHRPW